MTATIDLNSDLGEAFGSWNMGDDIALLDIVSSANIACGFHGGDAVVMKQTCTEAAQRGIRVGAHIAYRDLAGFGRRQMEYKPEDLAAEGLYQIGSLQACAKATGTSVSYVKPHGALYNRIAVDEIQAAGVIEAILSARAFVGEGLALMAQAGSVVAEMAQDRGIPVIRETFADRAYNRDGTLVKRGLQGAVINDAAAVVKRVVDIATATPIETVDGGSLQLEADSICLHGDTPGSVELSRAILRGLLDAGINVSAQH